MTSSRKIDVLIPVYNGAATIVSSVRSIQQQTITNLRIIVVDDGSNDDTGPLLAELAAGDPRLKIVTQRNGGIVDALNAGLALCDAEFVARHDADDLAFPNRLQVQLDYLEAHPDCIAVSSNVWQIDKNGVRLSASSDFRGEPKHDAGRVPSKEPYLTHPFLMVRRAAFAQVNGYRYVFHAEDTDLYWRLLPLGRLFSLAERLGEYRVHDESVSSRSAVNGRIQATASQLAALSAVRRAEGRPDISFEKSALNRYKRAESLGGVIEEASYGLSEAERAFLEISSSAKLLELATFRPYALDKADHSFIRRSIQQHARTLSFKHQRFLFRFQLRVADRLAKKGQSAEFMKLAPVSVRLSLPVYRIATAVAKRIRR